MGSEHRGKLSAPPSSPNREDDGQQETSRNARRRSILRVTGLPWRRLALAILIVALSALPVFLVGSTFLQLQREIELTTTGLGVATALFFLTASIASASLGRVVERIGWRVAIRVNSVSSALILVAIALFATSTASLSFLLVAAGAVYGLANPAANKALAELVEPGRRGLMFGLKHAGIPSSTLLAGLAVPTIHS